MAEVTLYTTPWCQICARVRPRFDDEAARHGAVRFSVIDVAENPVVGVRGVPTAVAVADDGTELARTTGEMSSQKVADLFAAAESATRLRGRLDPTSRVVRLGAGAALVVLGLASAQPGLVLGGIGFLAWGAYDLVPRG